MEAWVADLLDELKASGFRELAGARLSARLPLSLALVNRVVAEALRGSTAVRRVEVHPRPGDRFDVLVKLAWALVPPITIAVAVDEQPQFPASPTLVLKWSLAAGLGMIAAQFVDSINHRLPAGVRLEGDRVLLNIPALAAGGPAAQVMAYIKALRVHTVDDRTVVDVELGVDD